ncbi:S-adenosyl-L-methionine-dependent methyltransferase [Schizopora paradoxa]|uniref:type I protein arginine methyltransferase n=1 Tax=Schizopora paradoxa TaxID=27342 RepID=A0A0H2RQB2_9AGAM|nr:S-adenosyl-L-methionine-dependent methyltransferase [Schizopora paradoxa]
MGLHKLDATQSTDAGETSATSKNPGSSSQSTGSGYERLGDDDHDAPPSSDESSSTGDEDEEGWDDWGSDPEQKQPCPSLFDGTSLPSATEVLKHDKEKHGFDLEGTCKRLRLDFHGQIRLINYIRREKPTPSQAGALTGKEDLFSSDAYLLPALENDGLLQLVLDEESEDEADVEDVGTTGKAVDKDRIILTLRRKLEQAKREFSDYREFVQSSLLSAQDREEIAKEEDPSTIIAGSSSKGMARFGARGDDDTHYFDSYGLNDIHSVMLRDKVRTATYANFIFSSPSLFRDAVVLDVGCGTGILSLFAARAGARRVFAVDASANIVQRAKAIVKLNGLDDVVTVIQGKVEDIKLPDGITQVDVIISEWMGYALLYESMLDSVLVARDRFLKPPAAKHAVERGRDDGSEKGGVLVPSQTRMFLGLCSASEIYKDRVGYWSDVYGYDMSPMAEEVYDDAIVDVVGPETLLTEPVIIKDIDISTATVKQLNFTASFTLKSSTPKRQVAHAFILYFDAFFSQSGAQVAPDMPATIAKENEMMLAEVWRVGGARAMSPSVERRVRSPSRSETVTIASPPTSPSATSPSSPTSPRVGTLTKMRRASSMKSKDGREREREPPKETIKSFTTGPQSTPTHWKQTFFLLREPIHMQHGAVIEGTFHCRKSEENSRELDVEIHYSVPSIDGEGNVIPGQQKQTLVQTFKVR